MTWWSKLLGGTFGFLSAGPLGAIIGFAAGHTMAVGWTRFGATRGTGPADYDQLQRAFFDALFPALGHVAKADGRVSPHEIAWVEAIMVRMALTADQRAEAIRLFNSGKKPGFSLITPLDELRRVCQDRRALLRLYIELLLEAAYADGPLERREHEALKIICGHLGIRRFEFERLEAAARATRASRNAGFPSAGPSSLEQAYRVLGILPSASDDELKCAYRRLMHQHHPDKVAPGGLPVELAHTATQRTQKIRSAYDQIRSARRARDTTDAV